MALSIDWSTQVIYVPQADLTSLGGGLYELDLDAFRLELKDIEDSEEGIPFLDTHRHNTEVTLSGVTYARFVEIINGYTVEFENGTYTVVCSGANHNLADVKVVNSVSLIVGNRAGLITVVSGSGVTEQDKLDIADRVWDEDITEHTAADSTGEGLDNAGGCSSPSAIADAVWDEKLSTHTTTGSAGLIIGNVFKKIKLILVKVLSS